jgi:molecular chaperone Hsp33
MHMENCLIKALAYNKQARILFVENTDLIRAVCNQPNLMNRLLKTALGTTVSAASLLSGTLKDQQRISLKVKASQPAYKIFADVDSQGNIRGYVSEDLLNAPTHDLESLSIEDLIGDRGCIQVVKDIGMNRTFTGITDMPYRNIVDDLSHYFNQSEQTPTCFAIHIAFNENNEIIGSQGMMAQLLPGAPDELIGHIRNILARQPFQQPQSESSAGAAFRELPSLLFDDIEIMSLEPIRSFCGCSKEMFYPMLYALGKDELELATEKKHSIDMVCHICGNEYSFGPDEIAGLIAPRERIVGETFQT